MLSDLFAPTNNELGVLPLDEELMIGANNPSEVNMVEEIIVPMSAGGGDAVTVDIRYYDRLVEGGTTTASNFEEYVAQLSGEATAFAASHVHGDPNSQAYKQAVEAVKALWTLGRIGTDDPEATSPTVGPYGHTLSYAELLHNMENTEIFIGPFQAYDNNNYNAFTDIRGDTNKIYIDPTKLGDYADIFGTLKATNYVIYHELAHASEDGERDARSGVANLEARANAYGSFLAHINVVEYPTNAELSQFGGV